MNIESSDFKPDPTIYVHNARMLLLLVVTKDYYDLDRWMGVQFHRNCPIMEDQELYNPRTGLL
jgi:hypothetical protein